ncbi:metallophosphoesterase [uncultured Lutibacter sp.]|uniref:metallophosphoesterase n=1 Tax=uncultured Lutibacter sp. TaxID=437739 RepID=UPI002611489C|nr:metallophosphoesterase [uncultured Lutibacter sp.]
MRSYPFSAVLLLCFVILLVDIFAFYWLLSITQIITTLLVKYVIYAAFWIFTIGLIASIIILRSRLKKIQAYRRQLFISSLYGLVVVSLVPKFIFVVVFSTLYFTNYIISKEASLIVLPLIGLVSGFLPFFTILYGIFSTKYKFEVRRNIIKFKNLPIDFNQLKIVQISDLHLGSFSFNYAILEKAVTIINKLNPDFIFFTGDLVNNYAWELKGWSSVLLKLKAKMGKYAVLGNHDYGDYSKWKSLKAKQSNHESIKYFFKKIEFNLLLNSAEVVTLNKNKLAIIGVENWGIPPFKQYGDLQKALAAVKDVKFKILLSHDPIHWSKEVVRKTDISLTLSGHTHGMQAGVQTKNIKWSPIKYKYKHWAGLYLIGEQYLHVNKGLGWLGFPGRLGMRPEISLITIGIK